MSKQVRQYSGLGMQIDVYASHPSKDVLYVDAVVTEKLL